MVIGSHYSEFDPDSCSLDGVNLIEASAGTGKTYSISTLYQRLILEAGLSVEEILVVTFTEAATAELKDRIRKRLKDCLDLLKRGKTSENDYLADSLSFKDDASKKLAAAKLDIALRTFDRASIFTIHGFCRKVLQEQAFETGSMFDFGLEPDLSELDSEIVSDFLRTRLDPDKNQQLSQIFLRYLVDKDFFSGAVSRLLSETRPYLKIRINTVSSEIDLNEAEKDFLDSFDKVQNSWANKKNEISSCLIESESLNKKSYSDEKRKSILGDIQSLLIKETPSPVLFKDFEKLTASVLKKSTNKGKETPSHEFFDLCECLKKASDRLSESYRSSLSGLKKDFMDYFESESEKRKEKRNILGFNDLLLRLHSAVKGPMGIKICESLRKKFGAALIDEFQDTDHVQYDIFSTVFRAKRPLFLIGDPKQSIYGFRGADIFAYLKAAEEADRKFTLTTNWRSDEGLIKAVNALFSNRQRPFVFEGIEFFPSKASKGKEVGLLNDDKKGFLEIFSFSSKKTESLKKPENIIYDYVTGEISNLLSGKALLDERPVRAGDIAVLVHKHSQGKKLKRFLDEAGIPSVSSGGDDVFKSVEALYMERLLIAVSDPSDMPRIKAALTTPFFGSSAAEIYALSNNENEIEEILPFFSQLHETWIRKDFMQMFRQAMTRHGVMKNISCLQGGERTLTNLLHIAEILNQRESTDNLSREDLISWLSEKISSELKSGEDELLRLESDSEAVKIITIHKSKGLEFPIVFCPFPAKNLSKSSSSPSVIVHSIDGSDEYSYYDREHPDFEEAKTKSEKDDLAESARLLYVALTRAKHRCHVVLDKDSCCSALGNLLFHKDEIINGLSDFRKSISLIDEDLKDSLLLELSNKSEGTITISEYFKEIGNNFIKPDSYSPSPIICIPIRKIRQGRTITSFSGLTSGLHSIKTDPDIPDSFTEGNFNDLEEPQNTEKGQMTIFDFPKGAETGNFFHSFLENLDFSCGEEEIKILAEKKLQEFGFETSWKDTVTSLSVNLLSREIGQKEKKFRLSGIGHKQRINEMGFYYPIKKIGPENLNSFFTPCFENMEKLSFSPVKGFMRGFVDMIFEHEGIYYLLDWKSNHLGDNESDYSPEKLKQAMEAKHYILQYHLYVLALDLYLRSRIMGYSYEKHFGGVFYVFLRGIGVDDDSGIYFDRPDEKSIKGLASILFET